MAAPFGPVSQNDFDNFQAALDRFKSDWKEQVKKTDDDYSEREQELHRFLDRIDKLIQRHTATGTSKSGRASGGAHNPPIQLVKSLLGKLKNLVPQRVFGGRLRYLLDAVLQNLSPNDEWEFMRLNLFVKEVYRPSLMVLLEGRRQEMKAEAYDEYCRSILKYLLNEELKGQTA